MNKKKRIKKKIIVAASACMTCLAVFLSVFSSVYAAYDYWNELGYVDFRKSKGATKISLSDIITYGSNTTTNVGVIYQKSSPKFDDVRMEATSRVTYGKKIEVNNAQEINIIAATQDTADDGGSSINTGKKFYWSISEYDKSGYMVYDGEWCDSSGTWTIGKSVDNKATYGCDGYPKGVTQSMRERDVKYITPIFRWNNGDLHEGSGSNLNLNPDKISKTFPVFYLVTAPFTYIFDCNGGSVNINNTSKSSYTVERLGTANVDGSKIIEPARPGYKFTGWKIKDGTGKQKDKIYTTEQLKTMMSDGKYWSSLFENATFEAQWELNSYQLKLDADYCGVWFDKLKGDGYDLGTVDLYIDGKLEAANITDWEKTYPYGTTYEFKNLKSKNGYILTDAGSLKGTIIADTTATTYVYDKAGLAYFDKNNAGGGTGNDTFVYYSMVSLVYDKGAVMGNDSVGFGNKFNKPFMYWKTDKNNYYNGGDVMPVNDNYQGKAYIQSAGSGLVMDIAWGGASNDSGLNIQLADAWGGNGEYWSFIHVNGDDYFIVNSALGKYVTADTASMDVKYCNLDWSSSQMWTLSVAGDGCYYITSKANPNLRMTAQGTVANSNIGLGWKSDSNTKQKWKILFDNRDSVFTAQWGAALQQKVKVSVIARYEGIETGTYAKEEMVINRREYTVGTPVTWVRDKDDTYEDASFSELASKDATYYVTVKRKTHTVALNKQTGISAVSGNGTYRHGKNITINAAAKTGYRFTGWTDSNGKNISSTSSSQLTVTDDVTLTANAEAIDYTITYDLAGGTLDGKINPDRYNVETPTFTLNNPTRPGYIFAGWIGTELNTADKTVIINQGSTGNRSYTANWIVGTSHLKTFAGTGISSTNYASGADITVGKDVTVKADVKTGYLFTSWTNSSGNVVSTDNNYTFSMPVNDVNLTANAVPISYNIVFNNNKPSSATGNVTGNTAAMNNVKYDTAVTLTQNGYSLNGWNFTGWNTQPDGTGVTYNDEQAVKNLSAKDGDNINLYAQWTPVGYTVTTTKTTGISSTSGDGTYHDGDKVTINAVVQTGYNFDGWYLDNSKVSGDTSYSFTMTPGNKTFAAKATANNYTLTYNKGATNATANNFTETYPYGKSVNIAANKFTGRSYNISFDSNGGSSVAAIKGSLEFDKWIDSNKTSWNPSQNYTVERDMTFTAQWKNKTITFSTPSREGYTFTGWYDGNNKIDSLTIMPADTAYTKKLTAHWQINQYPVIVEHYIMDTNGNYSSKPDKTVKGVNGQPVYNYHTDILSTACIDKSLIVAGGIEYDSDKTPEKTTVTADSNGTVIRIYYKRIKHTVTFNVAENGGYWKDNTSNTNRTISVYYGNAYSSSDFDNIAVKGSNFDFKGWNTQYDTVDSMKPLNAKMGTGDITYYAIYSKDIVTTFIDCQGARTVNVTIWNKERQGVITVPAIRAYNWDDTTGCKPVGYNRISDINKDGATSAQVAGSSSLTVSDNATYYAVYTAKATLVYDPKEGTLKDSAAQITIDVFCNASDINNVRGVQVKLAYCDRNPVSHDGYNHTYDFANWESSLDGKIYDAGKTFTVTKNMIMTAVWNETITPITYTIHFEKVLGEAVTNVPDDITAVYDKVVTIPDNIPVRTGFTFTGWALTENASTDIISPGSTVKNLTTTDGSVVNLYAQWKQRKLVIVKASSTMYNDTIIRRTAGDDEWYNSVGKLTIDELKNYPDDKCVQVWKIDKNGNITQTK